MLTMHFHKTWLQNAKGHPSCCYFSVVTCHDVGCRKIDCISLIIFHFCMFSRSTVVHSIAPVTLLLMRQMVKTADVTGKCHWILLDYLVISWDERSCTKLNLEFLPLQAIWAVTCQNQQRGCVPSKDSFQPGHLPSLISLRCVLNG